MTLTLIATILLAAAPESGKEDSHTKNLVYRAVLEEGLSIEGHKVVLPAPRFRDGQSKEAEIKELRAIAGSDRAVTELLRDSISAPLIFKVRDEGSSQQQTLVRAADVWFAVRGDLDSIHPEQITNQASDAKPVEVGNMRFSTHLLDAAALSSRKLDNTGSKEANRWYAHFTSRLLGRIHVEATTQVVATRTDESWIIASRTDPGFTNDNEFPNRWWPFTLQGTREVPGKARPYEGGISYLKMSRLVSSPGTLFVEAHFAFAEPKPWFDGAPILRSKIGVIVQDQVRQLRREIAKAREQRGASPARPR